VVVMSFVRDFAVWYCGKVIVQSDEARLECDMKMIFLIMEYGHSGGKLEE